MHRKILSAVATLLIVAGMGAFVQNMHYSASPLTAFAETDLDGNEYTEGMYEFLTYRKYSDHVVISYCHWEAESVDIPAELEGLPVTEIGKNAFRGCRNLSFISIPDSVRSIGIGAFASCSGLTEITLPDSVKEIGEEAFGDCYRLQKITIPKGVTSINDLTFENCLGLSEITMPDSVRTIGYSAFSFCDGLTEISLPDSVTSIGNDAFYYCRNLSEVKLPDSLVKIGDNAFSSCLSLTKITIPESVLLIGEYAFLDCSSLSEVTVLSPDCEFYNDEYTISNGYDEDHKAYYNGIIRGCENSTAQAYAEKNGYTFEALSEEYTEGTYEPLTYRKYADHIVISGCDRSAKGALVIPEKIDGLPVTEIGDEAFYYCKKLTEVQLPDSVTSIGEEAFFSCEKLESVNIPNGITELKKDAFSWCENLKEIMLPDGVTEIGYGAFSNCAALEKINIPDSVREIGEYAFCSCKSLTEINIPDGVSSIGNLTFAGCKSITEINIPDSVTFIGNLAFESCNGLTEVTIPDGVVTISEGAFCRCDEITNVTVSATVEVIDIAAFAECKKLEAVTILNPDCKIAMRIDTISNIEEEDNGAFYDHYYGVIRGYENSTAQAYAQKYKRTFESLGEAPAEEILYGDANCDGAVTIADATAILQHLGNRDKYALSAQGEKNADVAEPSGITANDAIAIQQLDAGIIERLPENI